MEGVVNIQMKCSIMLCFIRVLTVCKSEKDLQTKEHDIVLNFTQAPPYTYNGLSQVYYINEKENPSVYKGLTKYQ